VTISKQKPKQVKVPYISLYSHRILITSKTCIPLSNGYFHIMKLQSLFPVCSADPRVRKWEFLRPVIFFLNDACNTMTETTKNNYLFVLPHRVEPGQSIAICSDFTDWKLADEWILKVLFVFKYE
jgi:hypothetical protein